MHTSVVVVLVELSPSSPPWPNSVLTPISVSEVLKMLTFCFTEKPCRLENMVRSLSPSQVSKRIQKLTIDLLHEVEWVMVTEVDSITDFVPLNRMSMSLLIEFYSCQTLRALLKGLNRGETHDVVKLIQCLNLSNVIPEHQMLAWYR